ncbi:MAG: hypothetical protein LBJ95_05175 [Oscillospiraceae bacterium]|jgi:hypothetical protein|nr:hypothetical protein [Oscillospiraceae bacterium]
MRKLEKSKIFEEHRINYPDLKNVVGGSKFSSNNGRVLHHQPPKRCSPKDILSAHFASWKWPVI